MDKEFAEAFKEEIETEAKLKKKKKKDEDDFLLP